MSRSSTVKSLTARLAEELAVEEAQVAAAVRLLDEGATVPFIARYRKEATGSLDDGQLRTLEERLRYLRELDARRTAVLASIEEQGKLTDELRAALMAADTKSRVEDIYLPYKPKRRTKAQIAREAGLEPLADRLLADPTLIPEEAATEFLCDDVADAPAALEGARHILAERAAEDAELVGAIREKFWKARFAADGGLVGRCGEKFCSAEVSRLLRVRRIAREHAVTPRARRDAWREGRSACAHLRRW